MPCHWIDAGGVSLRYELTGRGQHVVVLLHEMGGTLESWDFIVPVLQQSYRVLRYDMRGAGLSEKISGDVTGDQLTSDLAALLDTLGLLSAVALVGCAVGANVALRFAARYPDRTAALVVCSPATHIPIDRQPGVLDTIAAFQKDGLRSIEAQLLDASYAPVLRERDQARFEETRLRWLANDPASFAAVYRMLASSTLVDVLPAIIAPCLFIGCTLDMVRPAEATAAVAAVVKGASYTTVVSGHFLAIQSPDAMLSLLLPFLQKQGDAFTPAIFDRSTED